MPHCQKCGKPGAKLFQGRKSGRHVWACSPACARAYGHHGVSTVLIANDEQGPEPNWSALLKTRDVKTVALLEDAERANVDAYRAKAAFELSRLIASVLDLLAQMKANEGLSASRWLIDQWIKTHVLGLEAMEPVLLKLPENQSMWTFGPVGDELEIRDFEHQLVLVYDAMVELETALTQKTLSIGPLREVQHRIKELIARVDKVDKAQIIYQEGRSDSSFVSGVPRDVRELVADFVAPPRGYSRNDPDDDADVLQRNNLRGV